MHPSDSATGALGLILPIGPQSTFLQLESNSGAQDDFFCSPHNTILLDSSAHTSTAHKAVAHPIPSHPAKPTEAQLQPFTPVAYPEDHVSSSETHHIPSDPVRSILPNEPSFSSLIPPLTSQSPSHSTDTSLNTHSMTTRTKDRMLKQRKFSDYVALHSTADIEPNSFTQVVKSSHWRSAMATEIDTSTAHCLWFMPLPINE